MNTDRKGEKKLKYLKQYLKTHTHFLLPCDLFQKTPTWRGSWCLLVKPLCFRGLMAILCLAAEVSRQPRGLAGRVKSTGMELLPRGMGVPWVAENKGLMGLEEAPEGICKTKIQCCIYFLYILLPHISGTFILLAHSISEDWNNCSFGHKSSF